MLSPMAFVKIFIYIFNGDSYNRHLRKEKSEDYLRFYFAYDLIGHLGLVSLILAAATVAIIVVASAIVCATCVAVTHKKHKNENSP